MQRKLLLKRQLLCVRKSEATSVEIYLCDIEDILSQLAGIGEMVDEEELVYIILDGLPLSWGPFVSIFQADM